MTDANEANHYARRRRLARGLNGLARGTGLCAAARLFGPGRRATVLCYHRICDEERPLCTPVALFEAQMSYLARHFQPLALADFVSCLREDRPLPKRSVVLTFDDGYRDALTTALPILERYGMTATFFVTAGYADRTVLPWWETVAAALSRAGGIWPVEIDGRSVSFPVKGRYRKEYAFRRVTAWLRNLAPHAREERLKKIADGTGDDASALSDLMMDWDDVRLLAERGGDVGCHGQGHVPFVDGSEETVRQDLETARDRFEKMLGAVPRPLAFPFGGRPPAPPLRRLVREMGFTCAFTHSSPAGAGPTDLFALGRTGVESEALSHFAAKVSGLNLLFKRVEAALR